MNRRSHYLHTDVTDIATLFVKRMYAKGKLSIADFRKVLNVYFAGQCKDRGCSGACDCHEIHGTHGFIHDAVYYMVHYVEKTIKGPRIGVVRPVGPLTKDQQYVLGLWYLNPYNPEITGEDGPKGLNTLESIEWKFAPGWRKRYPEIPIP
jgi:hypothetical protein